MKNKAHKRSRRNFIELASAAILAAPLMGFERSLYPSFSDSSDPLQVHLFSKHLQFLDYNAMSEAAAEMGFDGLDLTVRPKGHVAPEKVVDDLPDAIAAMKKHGLLPQMMTTNVTNAENVGERKLLETASKLNLTHYRTGWLKYPENRSIAKSQEIFAQQFKNLEMANKELGLIGCYQNHAGNHVGAPIWDLPLILGATNNENMGCQYDIRHAVVEGGQSWELGLRLIQPFIKSIVIKDFKWGMVDGKWKPINTPLGEGMVDFDRYFSLMKKYGINVPISLHLEYDLGGAEHGAREVTLDQKEIFSRMKKDLTFLRDTWKKA